MNPWLIQRLEAKESKDPTGTIDTYFTPEYMGSAEYEFGAMPASLRRMAARLDEYRWWTFKDGPVDFQDRPIRVWASSEQDAVAMMEWVQAHIADEYHHMCKESPRLVAYMNRSNQSTRVWWSLDTDIVFCFDKHQARRWSNAMANLKKKWQK